MLIFGTSPGNPIVVVDLISLVSVAADVVHVKSNLPLWLRILEEQRIQNQQRQQMGEWPKTPDARVGGVHTEHDIQDQDDGKITNIKKQRVLSKMKIPDEIIFDVLRRLPVKSLMRFKCVCKAWNGFICQPHFAECHHIYSQARLNASHMLFWMEKTAIVPTNHEAVFSSQNPTHTLNKCEAVTEIVNGLICLVNLRNHLCVLNLTTGEKWVLPEAQFRWSEKVKHGKDFQSLHHSCMLGFDHVSKKYKVLRMIINERYRILMCRIFTFGALKWEEIDNIQQPFESPSLYDNQRKDICANGIIYWMGTLCINGRTVIQCLNVAQEKVAALLPPQDSGNIQKLIRIGGDLAVVCRSNEDQGSFSLWRLNNRANPVWIKNQIRLPCEMPTLNLQVIGSTKRDDNNEIIFTRKSKDFEVIIYNLRTQEIRNTTITCPGKPAMVGAFLSLVSGAAVTDFVENILPLKLPIGGATLTQIILAAKRPRG